MLMRRGWLKGSAVALSCLLGLVAWSCSDEDESPAGGDSGQLCVDSFDCPVGELCVNGTCQSDVELCEPGDEACLSGCEVDAECGPGERCNALTGECVEDDRPDDPCDGACEDDEVCDEDTGRCEAAPECDRDGDCASGEVCEGGECVAGESPECEEDADCGAGESCVGGACEAVVEEGCQDNGDCAVGERCNVLSGACQAITPDGACQTSADCAGGQTCNRVSMRCETPGERCLGPQDCAAGEVCNTVSGACEPAPAGCTSDAQCATGEACNTATGVCEAPEAECATSLDCAVGEECRSGQCRETGGGGGGQCTFSFECPVGNYCDFLSGTCAAGCGTFLDCDWLLSDEDCVNNQCVPAGTCSSDLDCGFDEVCLGGRCEYAECFSDAECPGREVCDAATATCVAGPPECTVDGDCGAGERCSGGQCVPEVASCESDPAEPNDTFPTATPLAIGATGSGLLCGEELDAFKVTMVVDRCYRIQANFVHADGDIDLYFLDEAERFEPFTSETTSDEEVIEVRNRLATDDYYVVVLLYDALPADSNSYTVRVTEISCN